MTVTFFTPLAQTIVAGRANHDGVITEQLVYSMIGMNNDWIAYTAGRHAPMITEESAAGIAVLVNKSTSNGVTGKEWPALLTPTGLRSWAVPSSCVHAGEQIWN